MKLQSPVKKFNNEKIRTTLEYGDTSFVHIYKLKGWDLAFHNGEDYVCSVNPKRTYGIPILAAQDGTVSKTVWDSPMSTKGNGLTITGDPFTDYGKQRILGTVYWHLSQISVNAGDRVKAGQQIGRMGQSGYVIGTGDSIHAGTHLHFGVYQYILKDGKWEAEFPNNGVNGAVKPSDWLEENWKDNAPTMGWADYLAYFLDIKKIAEKLKVEVS